MATSISLNGTSYSIPAVGEGNWGTSVRNYLIALSTGVLSKAGGSFTLTADVDFGTGFGLKSIYFKSRGTTATAGVVRLANTESVSWRNAANGADIPLKVNASDLLEINSVVIPTISSTSTITNKTLDNTNTITLKDTLFTVQDDGDTTKQFKLQLSGITTSTTRTWTVPDATSTFVGIDTTQTLTNKTLTSPAISSPTITSGATLRGDLLLQNSSGSQPTLQLSEDPDNGTNKITLQAPASLSADYTLTLPTDDGNSGQSLTTDGSGVLSWSSPFTNPMTTTGDIVYSSDGSGTPARLAVGASTTVLLGGTTPSYGQVANAQISSSAAIAFSKLASLTSAQILIGSAGNVATANAVTGDVTISNAGVTAIGTGKVTSTMILDDTIVNADINSSAAIAGSKIVSATNSVSGVVTTASQTFAGAKTFEGQILQYSPDANDTDAMVEIKSLSASGTGRQARFRVLDSSGSNQWSIQYDNADSTSLTETMAAGKTMTCGTGGVTQTRSTTSGAATMWTYKDGSGDTCGSIAIDATGNVTTYNVSSDARLKTNFQDFIGTDVVKSIKTYSYERLTKPGVIEHGVKAQELNEVYPQAVQVGGEDPRIEPWQVDYSKLVSVLLRAVKELTIRVEELEAGA